VVGAGHLDELEHEIARLEAEMARLGREGSEVSEDLAHRYDRARSGFEFGGGFARAARVERVLDGLGFAEPARARPLSSFSGGWLMRVELAKLLLSAPEVLLLDEPTNHLDLPSIAWFEATLLEYRGAALIVSHDRTFLRRHATRVAELDGARFTVYEGGYDPYQTQKEAWRAQLEAEARASPDRGDPALTALPHGEQGAAG
jgi:ATP-binding cassette subfamily F protein 3